MVSTSLCKTSGLIFCNQQLMLAVISDHPNWWWNHTAHVTLKDVGEGSHPTYGKVTRISKILETLGWVTHNTANKATGMVLVPGRSRLQIVLNDELALWLQSWKTLTCCSIWLALTLPKESYQTWRRLHKPSWSIEEYNRTQARKPNPGEGIIFVIIRPVLPSHVRQKRLVWLGICCCYSFDSCTSVQGLEELRHTQSDQGSEE